ncbi:hypothetical protein OSB04_009605 [Centaurea solstitialis]|uniref:GIR1-like zinc ribbon domain-containing protein n=1 Tax=Centaurea solstitialis TaxID=347529 RepID=A0AA38WNI7_9ASTR|nr:hypothetical protein OSB04_009605 [Centaurea solstitialis]
MSRRNDSGAVKLDLKLNLSPPRSSHHWTESSPATSPMTVSPTNSCVSFGGQDDHESPDLRYSSSPETTTSMMLAGCPRCLMYVMLSEDFPMCPQCKSTVLLDVVFDKPIINKSNT